MGFEELLGLLFLLYILGSVAAGFLRRGARGDRQKQDRPTREEELGPEPFEGVPGWEPGDPLPDQGQEAPATGGSAQARRWETEQAPGPWVITTEGGEPTPSRDWPPARTASSGASQDSDRPEDAREGETDLPGTMEEREFADREAELERQVARQELEGLDEALESVEVSDWAEGRLDQWKRRAGVTRLGGYKLSGDELRQAVLLREVLERPRAMRPYRPPGHTGVR